MLSVGQVIHETFERLKGKYTNSFIVSLMYFGIPTGLITLLYVLITLFSMLLSLIIPVIPTIISNFIIIVFSAVLYFFMVPFYLAWNYSIMDIYRNKPFKFKNLFIYLKENIKRSWCIIGRTILKLIVPIILIIVVLIVSLIISILSGTITIFTMFENEIVGSLSFIIGSILLTITSIALIACSIYLWLKSLLYSLTFYVAYDNPNMTAMEVVQESENLMKGNLGKYFLLQLLYTTILSLIILIILMVTCGFGSFLIFLIEALVYPVILFSSIIFYENRLGIYVCKNSKNNNINTNISNNHIQ